MIDGDDYIRAGYDLHVNNMWRLQFLVGAFIVEKTVYDTDSIARL